MKNDHFTSLIKLFSSFPGIGPRQAERFTRFIARSDKQFVDTLINEIIAFKKQTKQCPLCFSYHIEEGSICSICNAKDRRDDILIVVEKEVDISPIEQAGVLDGKYFILGGLLSIASEKKEHNRFSMLLERIGKGEIKEVILAFSVHPDAEHTSYVLDTAIKDKFPSIVVTRPARGFASGSEIEYSDPETIKEAFSRRTTQ